MKTKLAGLAGLLVVSMFAQAQVAPGAGRPGGGGMGASPAPKLDWMMELFEKYPGFTGTLVTELKAPEGTMTIPAQMFYLDGKTRLEIDLAKVKGEGMPPGVAQQMQAMDMAQMVSIGRPDRKETYLVYPGLKAYAVMPNAEGAKPGEKASDKGKVQRTELGKETVAGHPTTKYKVVMQEEGKEPQELTLWAASDLKDFPIRIENKEGDMPTTLTFQEVKFEKPAESSFNPPADFQRYSDVGTMLRESMMKRFNQGGTTPPAE